MEQVIFISYSSKIASLAGKLADRLRQVRHEVWVDRSSMQGGRWRQQVDKGLQAAHSVLVLFDRTYNEKAERSRTGPGHEWAWLRRQIVDFPNQQQVIAIWVGDLGNTRVPEEATHLARVEFASTTTFSSAEFDEVLRHLGGPTDSSILRSEAALQTALNRVLHRSLRDLQQAAAERVGRLVRAEDLTADDAGREIVRHTLRLPEGERTRRLMALGALALLLAPDHWTWTSAAYAVLPAWFRGPGDPAFQRHHTSRLLSAMQGLEPGQSALIDVLGTRGRTLRSQLFNVIREIRSEGSRGRRRYRDLTCRILVDGSSVFASMGDVEGDAALLREAEGDLRAAGIRVVVAASPTAGAWPFHGNRIGVRAGDGTAAPRHIYLGFCGPSGMKADPMLEDRPYLYLDAVPDVLADAEGSPLWFIDFAFRLFDGWFETLWQASQVVLEVGAAPR